MRFVWAISAGFAGYFLTWFLFGIGAGWLLLILLSTALALAYATDGKDGMWAFMLCLTLFSALPFFIVSLGQALNFADLTRNMGSDGAGITALYVFGFLFASGAILLALLIAISVRNWKLWLPTTPWIFVVGVAAFALAPAVPVDCRFMPVTTFQGQAALKKRFTWIDQPKTIPDQQEIPTGVKLEKGFFAATNCSADRLGRPRVFSFRASRPLLIYVMPNAADSLRESYAALVDPIDHKKLGRWRKLDGIWERFRSYHPYLLTTKLEVSGYNVADPDIYSYNEIVNLPPEFLNDLK